VQIYPASIEHIQIHVPVSCPNKTPHELHIVLPVVVMNSPCFLPILEFGDVGKILKSKSARLELCMNTRILEVPGSFWIILILVERLCMMLVKGYLSYP